MNPSRKLLVQVAGLLLALPLLYVLSSGPLLHYAEQSKKPLATDPPRNLFPSMTDKAPTHRTRAFYEPMLRAAKMGHWEGPLFAYLRVWHIFPMHMGHDDHVIFVVLSEPR